MKRYNRMSSLNKIGSDGGNNSSSRKNYEVEEEEGYPQYRKLRQYPARNEVQNQDKYHIIDEQTWDCICALRERASKFILSDKEETSTSESVAYDQLCYNDCPHSRELVYLKDLLNYIPKSEFLRKMKRICVDDFQHSPNLSDSFSSCSHCQRLCKICQETLCQNSSFREHENVKKLNENASENRTNEILRNAFSNQSQPLTKKSSNSRAKPECYTLEGLKPLKDDNDYNRTQTKDKKAEPQYDNVKKTKKGKGKSQHVSRSKKPSRCRSRKKRKSNEPTKCESQEHFEPTLKRPHEDSCERCWRFASPSRSPVNKPDQRFDPNFRKAHSCTDVAAYDSDDESVENNGGSVSRKNSQHVGMNKKSVSHVQRVYCRQGERGSPQQFEQHQNTPVTQRSEQPVHENTVRSTEVPRERPQSPTVHWKRVSDPGNIQATGNKSQGILYSHSNRRPRPKSYTPGVSSVKPQYYESFLDGINAAEYPNRHCPVPRRPHLEVTNSSLVSERSSRQIPISARKLEPIKTSEHCSSVANVKPVSKTPPHDGNSCSRTPVNPVGFDQVYESTVYPEIRPTNRSRVSPPRPADSPSGNYQFSRTEHNSPSGNFSSRGGSPRVMTPSPPNRTRSAFINQDKLFPPTAGRFQENSLCLSSVTPPGYSSTPNNYFSARSPHIKECPCQAEVHQAAHQPLQQATVPNNIRNNEKEKVYCCHCSRNGSPRSPKRINHRLNFSERENVPINERTYTVPSFEIFEGTFPPASYELSEDTMPELSYETNNGSHPRPPSQPCQVPISGVTETPIRDFDYNPQSCRHGLHIGGGNPGYTQTPQEKLSPCPYRQFISDKSPERSHLMDVPEENENCQPTFQRHSPRNNSRNVPSNGYGPVKYSVFYMTKNREDRDNEIEVLVEELTQRSSDKSDPKTKALKDKMKRVLECHSDSMALRFQKGVLESCKSPKSNRILYF